MLCLDKDRAYLATWKYMQCIFPGAGRSAIRKLNANAVGDGGGVMGLSWNGVHLVLSILELCMLNSMCGMYTPQSSCAGPTKCRSASRIIRFMCSTWPFACGWYENVSADRSEESIVPLDTSVATYTLQQAVVLINMLEKQLCKAWAIQHGHCGNQTDHFGELVNKHNIAVHVTGGFG